MIDQLTSEAYCSWRNIPITLTDQRSISYIWHEGAVPLLSGGRILAAVGLAYKSYQRLAKPRDTPAQRRANTEGVENCNHFAIT
jgi:hypothetical protein